jgi:hypothetical protein
VSGACGGGRSGGGGGDGSAGGPWVVIEVVLVVMVAVLVVVVVVREWRLRRTCVMLEVAHVNVTLVVCSDCGAGECCYQRWRDWRTVGPETTRALLRSEDQIFPRQESR